MQNMPLVAEVETWPKLKQLFPDRDLRAPKGMDFVGDFG